VLDLLDGLSGTGLFVALEVALVAVALVIAPRNREPSSALAWVLLMALVPVLGILLCVLIGSPRLTAGRREKQQNMDRLISEAARVVGSCGPARTRRSGSPRSPRS
jgi:cardiolipin synthase